MRILKGHEGKIGANALAYSPDGTLLASGGDEGAVRVWGPGDGHPEVRHQAAHAPGDRPGLPGRRQGGGDGQLG